jgi:cholesterol oxidase
MAEDTGKVQVLPLHVVTDVSEVKGGLYQVSANEIDVDGNVLGLRTFICKHLFMAAGAMGTPALLTKARGKGTLRKLNQNVGTGWGSNGAFLAARGGLGSFTPAQGGPSGHILMEDLANPFVPTDMVEMVVPKDFAQIALGGAPGFSLYTGCGIAPAHWPFHVRRDHRRDNTALAEPG